VTRLFIAVMLTFMLKQFYLAVLADASSRVKEEDATRVVRGIDEEVPLFVRYAYNKMTGRGPSFDALLQLLPEQQGEAVETVRRRRRIRRGITGTDRRAEDNIMENTFVAEDELTPALTRDDLATLLGFAAGRSASSSERGNTLVTKRALRGAIDAMLRLELEPREFRELEASATLPADAAERARQRAEARAAAPEEYAELHDSAEDEDGDPGAPKEDEDEEEDEEDDARTAARNAMTRRVVAATRASLRAVRREALLQRESVASSARVLDRLAGVEAALRDALAAARLSARRDGGDPAAMRDRIAAAMADVERREALRVTARRGWAAVRAAFLREAPSTESAQRPFKNLLAVVVAAQRKAKPADEFWVVLDKRINKHGFLRRKDKFFSTR
jgi:hypothetical protein